MQTEPVRNAAILAGAVQAVIMLGLGMAVSLGWVTLAPDQMGAVEKFVTAIIALAVLIGPQLAAAFWARNKVVPLASLPPDVAAQVEAVRRD